MCVLYANPYNTSVNGFFFSNPEEYKAKSSVLTDSFGQPVEEYEIDYVEGELSQLFKSCGIDQCTLGLWFEELEELSQEDQVEIYYRCKHLGQDSQEAIYELNDSGSINNCSIINYAYNYIDDCGVLDSLPEILQRYFDYHAFARDLELNGEVTEFRYDSKIYTASGF